MKIKDQFIRALVGGLIAGVIKDIPDIFLVELFKIKKLAFWDYVGVIIFSEIPHNFPEHLANIIIEVVFSAGIGIIYSMIIIPVLPTKSYLIRGSVYGSACGFTLISIVKLFNINLLITHDLFTPLATLFFSACYGLLLAFLENYFSPQKQCVRDLG